MPGLKLLQADRSRCAAVAGAAGLLCASVGGCGMSSTRPRAETRCQRSSAPSAAPHGPGTFQRLRAISSTSVPIDGAPLQAGLGAVWSASSSGLVKLSLPAATPSIIVHEPIDDVALSASCAYALARKKAELLEVDPRTLKVNRRWTVGPDAHSIVATNQNVYIASASSPTGIERINITSGTVTRSVIRGATAAAQDRAIAYGAGALWVTDGSTLYRLNPTRLSVLASTSLGVSDIWFGDGSLWGASENPHGGVERIDPATGRIVARSDADAIQIAFSPGAVWLAASAGPTAVDPASARTIAVLLPAQVLSTGSAGIAVVGNDIWTTYGDVRKLQRILPSR
jgi:hypothetical protein